MHCVGRFYAGLIDICAVAMNMRVPTGLRDDGITPSYVLIYWLRDYVYDAHILPHPSCLPDNLAQLATIMFVVVVVVVDVVFTKLANKVAYACR